MTREWSHRSKIDVARGVAPLFTASHSFGHLNDLTVRSCTVRRKTVSAYASNSREDARTLRALHQHRGGSVNSSVTGSKPQRVTRAATLVLGILAMTACGINGAERYKCCA